MYPVWRAGAAPIFLRYFAFVIVLMIHRIDCLIDSHLFVFDCRTIDFMLGDRLIYDSLTGLFNS